MGCQALLLQSQGLYICTICFPKRCSAQQPSMQRLFGFLQYDLCISTRVYLLSLGLSMFFPSQPDLHLHKARSEVWYLPQFPQLTARGLSNSSGGQWQSVESNHRLSEGEGILSQRNEVAAHHDLHIRIGPGLAALASRPYPDPPDLFCKLNPV